jgi:hypothetical protein
MSAPDVIVIAADADALDGICDPNRVPMRIVEAVESAKGTEKYANL